MNGLAIARALQASTWPRGSIGLGRRVPAQARDSPDSALLRLERTHLVLLALAILTILGAVAGSHGMFF